NVKVNDEYYDVRKVLKEASTKEKTVIITFLNKAWASPNSTFDLFLESFRIGVNTSSLLNHLLVISMDDYANYRCQSLGLHCYLLSTYQASEVAAQANFMTSIYLDMMWTRLGFLHVVLSMGYSFIVTDTDVMWLRNPYPYLSNHEYDIQTSCDTYNGRELDLDNSLNLGFMLVRSNNRTIEFYKFWISSRQRYPKLHEQNVFHKIKEKFTGIIRPLSGLLILIRPLDYLSIIPPFTLMCSKRSGMTGYLLHRLLDVLVFF
ncbi:hypothetical protein RDABS01_028620, partial [Bienertia sinuspersici]